LDKLLAIYTTQQITPTWYV